MLYKSKIELVIFVKKGILGENSSCHRCQDKDPDKTARPFSNPVRQKKELNENNFLIIEIKTYKYVVV